MPGLIRYGWDESIERAFAAYRGDGDTPGRIAVDYAQDYLVVTDTSELRVDMSGRMRRAVERGEALKPAVGDWVVIEPLPSGRGLLHGVLPRRTKLSRKVAGRTAEEQVVAANVDVVFLVVSASVELNLRRLERNLTLAHESGARPVVVLTKADLCDDPEGLLSAVRSVVGKTPVHLVSNRTGEGLEALGRHLVPGETVVLVGVSGVGKSSLVNRWLGCEVQAVGEVRESDQKGRHTTTHRQLFVLPSGALVIDTPGVRELALWEGDRGLDEAFPDVAELARGCRFRDCRHDAEPDCAVREAVERGRLEAERLDGWRKLAAELEEMERMQRMRRRPPPRSFRSPSRRR